MADSALLEALAGEGKLVAYFGYGSLVNPDTHRTRILGHTRAVVTGWGRRWQARPDIHEHPIALLSAMRAPGNRLDGLLVFDHADNLPSVDEREAGYNRHALSSGDLETELPIPAGCPLYIYEARKPVRPDHPHVILQSYLDAVLQGYRRQYGADAVDRFVAVTEGFDTPLLTDRNDPLYPRAVVLTDEERAHIDGVQALMALVERMTIG